jgi:tetratricopeptide (TPR) repeat protein
MAGARALMARQEYEAALGEVDKVCRGEDDVVCLLEEGLLLHYAGQYDSSNKVFERAEVRTEDLYTKSISRQAASLATSDLVLEYAPRPFEQVLINYFRALNYMFLGDEEGALVECRKASEKLARFSEDEARPYRQDAFLEYVTGILYEWGGETNDAFISYRNASAAYETYRDRFGIPSPPDLACDIVRTAEALGFKSEAGAVPAEERARCTGWSADSAVAPADLAKIVVFVERGFVPPMHEIGFEMPILKSEAGRAGDDAYDFSLGISPRVHGGFVCDASDVEYYLRIALPAYPDLPDVHGAPCLYLDSVEYAPAKCEDVFAIARAELDHDMPKIVAKTLARAIVKYKMTEKAEGRWGWFAGTVLNIFTAATEEADLRSWLSLPRAIHVAIIYVRPGPHSVFLPDPPGAHGDASAGQKVRLDTKAGTTNFVRFRQY